VPPYDDVFVMAGQGTVGREIAEDCAALAVVPDIVASQASGGGLIGGIAVAVKSRFSDASIVVAEPAGFHDHELSLKAGKPVPHGNPGRTICDALMASQPGDITFSVNRHLLGGAVNASDDEVMEAMAFAFRELKLVVEPGGAVALAALLKGKIDARGKTAVIVLSGGNVDPEFFAKVITQP
jgi:threonine dehydratase